MPGIKLTGGSRDFNTLRNKENLLDAWRRQYMREKKLKEIQEQDMAFQKYVGDRTEFLNSVSPAVDEYLEKNSVYSSNVPYTPKRGKPALENARKNKGNVYLVQSKNRHYSEPRLVMARSPRDAKEALVWDNSDFNGIPLDADEYYGPYTRTEFGLLDEKYPKGGGRILKNKLLMPNSPELGPDEQWEYGFNWSDAVERKAMKRTDGRVHQNYKGQLVHPVYGDVQWVLPGEGYSEKEIEW